MTKALSTWFRRLFPALCVGWLLCHQANGQVAQFEGRPIADIQFSPPAPLDPADLAKAQPLKKGVALRAEDVAHAIDGLFATGRFDDIAVEAEPSNGGVAIRFVTKPRWFVGGVLVDGKVMTDPNRAQVANAAQFSLGAPFQDADVTRAADNIRRLLEANGLYVASVTPNVERDNDAQQVFITFQVKEGKRAKYEMPTIAGDTKLPDSTIIRATGWRIPIIHWWRQVTDTRTHNGVQGVLGKYAGQDRLTARVDLKKLDYDREHNRVRPNLDINAGPKIRVKAVEAKVSKRVLKRYVPVFQQHAVDNDLLAQGGETCTTISRARAITMSTSTSAARRPRTTSKRSNMSSPADNGTN